MNGASANRPLLRNTFFAGISSGSAVLMLALLIVAGRVLGDEDYGKFSFALALATIFETFVDLGLKEVATRSVARDRSLARRLISNTIALKVVLAAVTMTLLVLVARVLRTEPDVRLACYLLGVSAVLRSYLLTARHLLMGLDRFELDSMVVVGDRLLLLTVGVAVLLLGHGVVGLAVAFVIARSIAVGGAYWLSASQVGRFAPTVDLGYWRELQRRALPFGAFVIVFYLYSYIDTVMLGVLRTDAETGLYSAAYRIYEGLSNVPAILYAVLMPRLALYFVQDGARHRRLARRGLLTALLLAIPVTAGALVVAAPAVELLFGRDYGEAAGVLRILAVGFVFVFPIFVLQAEAISVNAERLLLQTAIAGCAVNVMLNALLIPAYGMYGAASATVIGEFVSLMILVVGLRRGAILQEARSSP